jgi:hypothetical protein
VRHFKFLRVGLGADEGRRAQQPGTDPQDLSPKIQLVTHAISYPHRPVIYHSGVLAPQLWKLYPRPTKGILVAMMVMNWTLASSGRFAMYTTASATCFSSRRGSAMVEPLA